VNMSKRASITTKKGDKGQTSLYSGEGVWKDDLRMEANGTLDELDAYIGDAKHLIGDEAIRQMMSEIQQDLYNIMSELASKHEPRSATITSRDVDKLTELVNKYESLVLLPGFVLPGSIPVSARLDICRTVARRAERRIVSLHRAEPVPAPILQYLNRLSDLLYILARWLEKTQDALVFAQQVTSND